MIGEAHTSFRSGAETGAEAEAKGTSLNATKLVHKTFALNGL